MTDTNQGKEDAVLKRMLSTKPKPKRADRLGKQHIKEASQKQKG